jgi:hypothetical protein
MGTFTPRRRTFVSVVSHVRPNPGWTHPPTPLRAIRESSKTFLPLSVPPPPPHSSPSISRHAPSVVSIENFDGYCVSPSRACQMSHTHVPVMQRTTLPRRLAPVVSFVPAKILKLLSPSFGWPLDPFLSPRRSRFTENCLFGCTPCLDVREQGLVSFPVTSNEGSSGPKEGTRQIRSHAYTLISVGVSAKEARPKKKGFVMAGGDYVRLSVATVATSGYIHSSMWVWRKYIIVK